MKKTRLFTFLVASLFTLAISAQGIVVHQGNSKQVSFKSKDVQKIEFTESQVENSTDNYVEKSELDDLLDKLREEIYKKVDAIEADKLWSEINSILESIKDLYSVKADKNDYDQQKEECQKYEKKVDEILNDYLTSADKKELKDYIDKVLKDYDDAITKLTQRVETNEKGYEQNKKDIADLAQRVSTVEDGVKKINEELSTLNNTLNDKASQSALKELSDIVKELKEKIDAGGGSGGGSDDTNMNNGHEYVDLGLSVKWATMNVGATEVAGSKTNSHTGKLDCYGEYYAWGETSPKDSYTWDSYTLCNGSDSSMTKYCTDSSKGTVDNKTTLDLEDDAAHVNWGGSWRMPTFNEMNELKTQCTWTQTKMNGVAGYKVSASNGNSIFLPKAGSFDDDHFEDCGSLGIYWASTLSPTSAGSSLSLWNGSSIFWEFGLRKTGYSVRPVCP